LRPSLTRLVAGLGDRSTQPLVVEPRTVDDDALRVEIHLDPVNALDRGKLFPDGALTVRAVHTGHRVDERFGHHPNILYPLGVRGSRAPRQAQTSGRSIRYCQNLCRKLMQRLWAPSESLSLRPAVLSREADPTGGAAAALRRVHSATLRLEITPPSACAATWRGAD